MEQNTCSHVTGGAHGGHVEQGNAPLSDEGVWLASCDVAGRWSPATISLCLTLSEILQSTAEVVVLLGKSSV